MSDVTEESLREAVQLGGYSGLAMGKSKVAARSGRPAQALFRTNGSAFQMLSNPLENAVKNEASEIATRYYVEGFEAGINAPSRGGKRKTRRSRK